MTGGGSDTPGLARPEFVRVLESAARLQEVVPDAVLVGGSAAAALWANHRASYDHGHVLQDLSTRFDAVLEAIEATEGWVTNRVTPGKIILGELGDIESGVRQLIRNRPLEVTEVTLPSGHVLRVPTPDETLRIKGYLIVRRNQVRDYRHVAVAPVDLYVREGRALGGPDSADAAGSATSLRDRPHLYGVSCTAPLQSGREDSGEDMIISSGDLVRRNAAFAATGAFAGLPSRPARPCRC